MVPPSPFDKQETSSSSVPESADPTAQANDERDQQKQSFREALLTESLPREKQRSVGGASFFSFGTLIRPPPTPRYNLPTASLVAAASTPSRTSAFHSPLKLTILAPLPVSSSTVTTAVAKPRQRQCWSLPLRVNIAPDVMCCALLMLLHSRRENRTINKKWSKKKGKIERDEGLRKEGRDGAGDRPVPDSQTECFLLSLHAPPPKTSEKLKERKKQKSKKKKKTKRGNERKRDKRDRHTDTNYGT